MLRFIIKRIQLQQNLYKYNDQLINLFSKNPRGVLIMVFKERDLIYKHSNLILNRNIHLNQNDMYMMNKEIKEFEQSINLFLNKNK